MLTYPDGASWGQGLGLFTVLSLLLKDVRWTNATILSLILSPLHYLFPRLFFFYCQFLQFCTLSVLLGRTLHIWLRTLNVVDWKPTGRSSQVWSLVDAYLQQQRKEQDHKGTCIFFKEETIINQKTNINEVKYSQNSYSHLWCFLQNLLKLLFLKRKCNPFSETFAKRKRKWLINSSALRSLKIKSKQNPGAQTLNLLGLKCGPETWFL